MGGTSDGKVDVEAFVSGCLQMKGTASTVDLHLHEYRTTGLLHNQMTRIERVEKLQQKQLDRIMGVEIKIEHTLQDLVEALAKSPRSSRLRKIHSSTSDDKIRS